MPIQTLNTINTTNRLTIVFIVFILIHSCNKDDINYTLDSFILAGQKEGPGIEYVDFDPDIHCTIVDPWEKTDTTIHLDLDRDGTDDFSLHRSMCHPSMLGADCESVTIIPLMENEVCIDPETSWLDTLSIRDSINTGSNWNRDEALIYSFYWVYEGETSTEGYWQGVNRANQHFIGFKIVKNDKVYFGWMGMRSDSTFRTFDFYLTDYAILKDYPE